MCSPSRPSPMARYIFAVVVSGGRICISTNGGARPGTWISDWEVVWSDKGTTHHNGLSFPWWWTDTLPVGAIHTKMCSMCYTPYMFVIYTSVRVSVLLCGAIGTHTMPRPHLTATPGRFTPDTSVCTFRLATCTMSATLHFACMWLCMRGQCHVLVHR